MTGLQYTVRKTTPEEFNAGMPYQTSSMIEAVNTCIRWGIIRNVERKTFVTGFRQMALEAGSLMHDVFAALNFFHVGHIRNCPDHMHHHAKELFGEDRWTEMYGALTKHGKAPNVKASDTFALERLVYETIATSDFYDDPNDRNRTVANLEHCGLELISYWQIQLSELPIYIADKTDPIQPIGVEQSLDVVFEITDDTPDHIEVDGKTIAMPHVKPKIRFIGLCDAVYQNEKTKNIATGEYKTSSSMNEGWRRAFETRHQITAYNGALQAYFGEQETFKTILIGSAIPVRKTSLPVEHFEVSRDNENMEDFLLTALYTREMIDRYKGNPLVAPMFTHSCNRYFRPCSFMDLCTAAKSDQEAMYFNMEIEQELSPSEMKALMRSM